ncbi:hypothetical protein CXG81DRAFT_17140 [Caulochytrium protostelioides]|uniref:Uncharacterized protein n=1 Tax=Caulochytrium protostelioides TaxID=1555241 RepID=A0A4P9XCU9_9FUNG|nr:hypothetical protein CXG81DRAFT_17140 [Caulochytrium protostelioides]|eukprot:RKP03286.1 hypothetical protein CXG81DRAFT_17140 [Caulochytrium protostelioides]
MSSKLQSVYAPNPSTTRGHAVHLGGDPKGANMLYTNGRSVVIRNLDDPSKAHVYSQHAAAATVARYAPSGYYIASGDVAGNIRIWDTTNLEETILKTETRAFNGRINDLAWDFESKRLIAVGEGRERFGHAFLFDSASSVGEITGHAKVCNAVSIRPGRPLRAVTASDDLSVNFYHGVPFKFNKSLTDHTRFVQCVRYNPDGSRFVSTGMDGKLFLYDGTSGDKLAELSTADNAHTGGIFSASWSPDGQFLLTGSADNTAKIWDVAATAVVNTFSFGDQQQQPEFQQVGTLWQGAHLVALSGNGDFNYLDRATNQPSRTVVGHTRGITALTATGPAAGATQATLWSASYDGRVCAWDNHGVAHVVTGTGHAGTQVVGLAADVHAGTLQSVGMDNMLLQTATTGDAAQARYDAGAQQALTGVPVRLAAAHGLTAVVTSQDVVQLRGNSVNATLRPPFAPTAVALNADASLLAIGGKDTKTRVYAWTPTTSALPPQPLLTLEANRGEVTCIAFAPGAAQGDGRVAVADAQRQVLVYGLASGAVEISQWVFHAARVNSIAWSPSGAHAVSGSLDTNVEVWSVATPMKHVCIKNAHTEGVSDALFLDENTVVSAGADGLIKTWQITY